MQTETDTAATLAADAVTTAAQALGEGWLQLASVRRLLTGIPRATQDAALRKLALDGELILAPQANQKLLTGADRAAAVWFGNEANHLIRRR